MIYSFGIVLQVLVRVHEGAGGFTDGDNQCVALRGTVLDAACRGYRGRLKRSARAVQLFGHLAVLETHTFRY